MRARSMSSLSSLNNVVFYGVSSVTGRAPLGSHALGCVLVRARQAASTEPRWESRGTVPFSGRSWRPGLQTAGSRGSQTDGRHGDLPSSSLTAAAQSRSTCHPAQNATSPGVNPGQAHSVTGQNNAYFLKSKGFSLAGIQPAGGTHQQNTTGSAKVS